MDEIKYELDYDYVIDGDESIMILSLSFISSENWNFLCKLSKEDIVYEMGTSAICINEEMSYFVSNRSSMMLFLKSNSNKPIMISKDSEFFSIFIETSEQGKKKLIIRAN